MQVKELHDRETIHDFFLQDPYRHIYELGNLQDKLFPRVKWHAAEENGVIRALSMFYPGHEENVLFLLGEGYPEASAMLLQEMLPDLPAELYCHISRGLAGVLSKKYEILPPVTYLKMKLTGDILLNSSIKFGDYTYRVNKGDFEQVQKFILSISPQAFFNHAMLETGKYFCIRKNNDILATAGVHFYTKEFSAAAIGNVAVVESERGKGLAKSITASISRELWNDGIKFIGLNVRADNAPAIAAYEKIGFQPVGEHEEVRAKIK